jgi:hypothetical protein
MVRYLPFMRILSAIVVPPGGVQRAFPEAVVEVFPLARAGGDILDSGTAYKTFFFPG